MSGAIGQVGYVASEEHEVGGFALSRPRDGEKAKFRGMVDRWENKLLILEGERDTSACLSTRSLKKNFVVSSVAIPVGTMTPWRPTLGPTTERISSAKTA